MLTATPVVWCFIRDIFLVVYEENGRNHKETIGSVEGSPHPNQSGDEV